MQPQKRLKNDWKSEKRRKFFTTTPEKKRNIKRSRGE